MLLINASVVPLDNEDSALIIRRNGDMECVVNSNNRQASESTMFLFKVVMALDSPDFLKAIMEMFDHDMAEMGY